MGARRMPGPETLEVEPCERRYGGRMADMTVRDVGSHTFEVTVAEESSSTTHRVTVHPDDLEGLPDATSEAELVEASFRFLLDRESKESILRNFELGVISRYFSDYREKIHSYL